MTESSEKAASKEPPVSKSRPADEIRNSSWFDGVLQYSHIVLPIIIFTGIRKAKAGSDFMIDEWPKDCLDQTLKDPVKLQRCQDATLMGTAPNSPRFARSFSVIDPRQHYVTALSRPLAACIPSAWHNSISLDSRTSTYAFCAPILPLCLIAFWLSWRDKRLGGVHEGSLFAFAVIAGLWFIDIIVIDPSRNEAALFAKMSLAFVVTWFPGSSAKSLWQKGAFAILTYTYTWHCAEVWAPNGRYYGVPGV